MFNNVSDIDWAYTAGIIDGEGCIGIKRTKGRGLTTYIQISNTEISLIDWFVTKFGGSIDPQIPAKNSHQRPYFVWRLPTKYHNDFITHILPHLTIKKRRAEIMLEARTTIGATGQRLLPNIIKYREQLLSEFTTLNARGFGHLPKSKHYW